MNIVALPGERASIVADPPRRWFGQPYGLLEALRWVSNNCWGPSRRYAGLVSPLPRKIHLQPIVPRLRLAFVGDILPVHGRQIRVGHELRDALIGVDLLIANFEGTICDHSARRVFMAQAHSPAITEVLADLFPPARTLLNVANNHAGDFGSRAFEQSCDRLARNGFHVFGRRDRPGLLVDGVAVAGYTVWSNQPCDWVCRRPPVAPTADFHVLYPHWGYELQAYPHPSQIALAQTQLAEWNTIVGHHSHWPQPVTVHPLGGRPGLVAYSLGNLTFGLPLRRHLRGRLVDMEIGPCEAGGWGVGWVRWHNTRIALEGRTRATLELEAPAAD